MSSMKVPSKRWTTGYQRRLYYRWDYRNWCNTFWIS